MRDKLKGMLIALAAIAALGAGGVAIAGAAGGGGGANDQQSEQSEPADKGGADDQKAITGAALDRASAIALKEVGSGKVTQTEAGDEEGAYEVEVTRADGSQVDVHLDKQFNVLDASADKEESGHEDSATEGPGGDGDGETSD